MILLKRKNFHLLNTATLLLVAVLLWLKDSEQNFIFWPGAYLLSIWLLSSLFFQISFAKVNTKKLIIHTALFSLGHLGLTILLTLILERFFRIEEHYSLSELPNLLIQNWTLIIDGIIWHMLYKVILTLIDTQSKVQYLEERTHELEKELGTAELRALRKEINPHFLFNAMNGIAMKVRLKENKAAVSMIAALNELLRLSLSKTKEELITVKEELKLLESYLLIEEHRFGDKANITINFPDETLEVKIPELILQPLVENAFKHGMSMDQELQHIRISGHLEEQQIVLSVYNTKTDTIHLNFARSGVGLPNIVHRLRRIYLTNFKFQSFDEAHGIAFKITLPLQP